MITRMCRLRIYGPMPLLEETTSLLQELGVVHVERPAPQACWGFRPLEAEGDKARELVEMETLLERLRKILLLLPPPPGGFPPDADLQRLLPGGASLPETLSGLLGEAEELHQKLKELRGEKALLRKYERVVRSLAPIMERVQASPQLELVGITIDRSAVDAVALIREALDRQTEGDFQIFTADLDRETIAAVLVFGRSHSRLVRELLLERDLSEIRLPGAMADLSLKEALGRIRRRLELLPKEIQEAVTALERFSERWYATLDGAREEVHDRVEQVVMTRRFLCSRYSFHVSGWIPLRERERLSRSIEERFQGSVAVEMDECAPCPGAPVEIRNPALVRPFEVFMNLLPLPSYGSVDPAPYFAFFFPLFFGLILGDIGYGLVIMALALLVRRRSGPGSIWHGLAAVFMISSCYAVFFGVLFGEFFSTLGHHLGLLHYIGRPVSGPGGEVVYHPLLYDRIEAMTTFLVMAVAIGALHVFLGLILSIFNALHTRRYQRFFLKAGMLLALLCCCLLVFSLVREIPAWLLGSSAILLAADLIAITMVEGFVAPIELLSSIGNILSYARIMAIGLASVILGLVANRLGSLPDSVAAGILIALVLHGINIVFGIFSPTIHSMRLHFVEFFGKFYEPGGKPYQPFRKCKGV
jgi:V/A-type H+-transporting ATPase subunit I